MTRNKNRSYEEIILEAGLADYAPVRGCMVIRPYGYALWENIQYLLDQRFKALGVQNAYFPTLIPESFFQREKEHVKGFSPQCAVVTHGGGKKLEEPLYLRPTSETMINEMYAKWIRSYRDLPMVLNQWANVFRWELRTKLFLRTLEFLWQEGHTAHETKEEARERTLQMLQVYKDFLQEDMGIFCFEGVKTENERFAGATETYSVEVLLRDGKALQAGTSHDLGQNFAKVFNIRYQDRNQKEAVPYQTSWGVSTRLIGGLILAHQDEKGLVLPPKLAAYQVVVIPIGMHKDPKIGETCQKITKQLFDLGVRVKLDDSEHQSPGWKFNEYELKGVPLRIEMGKRDLDQGIVTLGTRLDSQKESVPIDQVCESIPGRLRDIQKQLLERHRAFTLENLHTPKTYKDFQDTLKSKGGLAYMFWDGSVDSEQKIQKETKATIRCMPHCSDVELDEPKNSADVLLGKTKKPIPVILGKSH
jgi:prolyl-tRNA synthetase